MAKGKNIIIGFLWLFGSLSICAQSDLRVKLVKSAESQLGNYELTGHNDGEKVEMYLASVGRKKGDAWCAAFVSWNYQQVKIPNPKSGWSPSWFPKDRVIYVRGKSEMATPLPGDVMGLYFQNLGRIGHVGIIYQWGEKKVITIEGNTNEAGSREGDGVYKKIRLKRQIYAVSNWIDDIK